MPATTRCLMNFVAVMLLVSGAMALWRPVQRPNIEATGLSYQIDINRADGSTLALLPGIGPQLGLRIAEHRSTHGDFANLKALEAVNGIGPRTIERARPWMNCRGRRNVPKGRGKP